MSLSGWLSGQSTFIFSFIVVFFRIKTHIQYFSFEIYNFKRVFHTKMFFVGFQSTSLCFSCHCSCFFNTPLYVFIYILDPYETKQDIEHIYLKLDRLLNGNILLKNTPFMMFITFSFARIMSLLIEKKEDITIF